MMRRRGQSQLIGVLAALGVVYFVLTRLTSDGIDGDLARSEARRNNELSPENPALQWRKEPWTPVPRQPHAAMRPGANEYQMHGRIGLDAQGQPMFKLQPKPEKTRDMAGELKAQGFNLRLSNSLSLDRNVSDHRHGMCASVKYDLDAMPLTTVVFVFHNEALSTLLRSVHSVLNRSPPKVRCKRRVSL